MGAEAHDPRVLAIKMTVYRTGDDSPFIHTLIRAAEARKQVVVLVELKARFDEERNILLAHALEKAGCHVVYGVVGLKVHTKTTLVVRQDPDGIRWIRDLLNGLAAQGRTVFLSSHLISEMALTATHLVVVGRGRLLADTTVAELVATTAKVAEDARRHPAAHPDILSTSAEKGFGIPELRAAVLAALD